jgi:asparagine synthase (glutamine-hydrolysing)
MCGFSGFIDLKDHFTEAELSRMAGVMAATLEHRGPDDSGTWADAAAGVAFGFRRLSIVDLSPAGHQPMVSADGQGVIVFNGEVYNAARLRPELERLGRSFRGHSDTEVLLEACRAWGPSAAVSKFIGMFSFAYWDRTIRRLSLVRDRMGIKPLYYGQLGSTFFFGSQPKSFASHPDWTAEIDRDSLADYLRLNYVPSHESIYAGLQQVHPGRIVTFDVGAYHDGSPALSEDSYWDFRSVARDGVRGRFPGTFQDAVDEMDGLLRTAVRDRLISDVPLGAFLSGGIDSSSVVAAMCAVANGPVRTFSIGFAEKRFDEAPFAKAVAAHLGTRHEELYVPAADALSLVEKVSDWFDEPFADNSVIPTYLVSRLARRQVTVALSGDGGDELFGGYPWYGFGKILGSCFARVPRGLRRALACSIRGLGPAGWDRLGRLLPAGLRPERGGDRLHKIAALLDLRDADAVYRVLISQWPKPHEISPLVTDRADEAWRGTGPDDVPDFLERMLYYDTLAYLPDDILTKVDRASMAVGLEARVPLLDHRIVEFAWRLPMSLRCPGGVPKGLLREVLARYVPRSLFERPKQGFEQPIAEWLRGPLRAWAEDLLSEASLRRDGLFDPGPIRARWTEHLTGRRNWQYPLWNVLMFQEWHRRWL